MQSLGIPSDVPINQLLIVTILDLLDQHSTSEQRLDEPFRSHLVEELEQSLVNRQRLKLYTHTLNNVLGTRKGPVARFNDEAYNSVLINGLAVLSDRDLLRLGLDGPELCALHFRLKEDDGSYWKKMFQAFYGPLRGRPD